MVKFFDQIVSNFEMSLRGESFIQKRKVKAFPHFCGSVFISKIISQLKTIVTDKGVFANLDKETVNKRIFKNGDSLNLSLILDETVKTENMLLLFESFQNISIDVYKGMKEGGKFGQLQKELKLEEEEEKIIPELTTE